MHYLSFYLNISLYRLSKLWPKFSNNFITIKFDNNWTFFNNYIAKIRCSSQYIVKSSKIFTLKVILTLLDSVLNIQLKKKTFLVKLIYYRCSGIVWLRAGLLFLMIFKFYKWNKGEPCRALLLSSENELREWEKNKCFSFFFNFIVTLKAFILFHNFVP